MGIGGRHIKGNLGFITHWWTSADVDLRAEMPSHGGNTGSNPVGDANEINSLFIWSSCRGGFVRKIYGMDDADQR